MKLTLDEPARLTVLQRLQQANGRVAVRYPGEREARQPVHTVYGGAHLFKANSAQKLGAIALRTLDEYAPDATALAEALEMDRAIGDRVYEGVRAKLAREPVEDFRIDFEDGYGHRPDAEEDGHAAAAAEEVALGCAQGETPHGIGIRIKPFTDELKARSIRTLDIFLTTLVERMDGELPPGFVVTLPKVTCAEQVAALADLFDVFERSLPLAAGSLELEIMVESPQAIIDERGSCPLMAFVDGARGRCTALHFGTYDYTASLGITAAHQHMQHPSCDFARRVMQVAMAGTGIWLSDGATNVMPVPVHRARQGQSLTPGQLADNRKAIHRAWKLHYDHVQSSLVNGFYQGWDLHPSQLPTRYAAVHAFFLTGMDEAAGRLRNFVAKAAQATLVGEVFDDAATGQGLLNYFLRAMSSGAVGEAEAVRLCSLTLEELRTRSFAKILQLRR